MLMLFNTIPTRLPPTFSMSSNNGFELTLPYYFNIAPNRDLTITPRILSKRGLQTQATFRYLSPNYSGTFYAVQAIRIWNGQLR